MEPIRRRPLTFDAAGVRAIIRGTQTQTRRVGGLPRGKNWIYAGRNGKAFQFIDVSSNGAKLPRNWNCPVGNVGEVLRVKEPFLIRDELLFYQADQEPEADGVYPWRAPTYMSESATRLWIEITGIRVERIEDISEEDAKASGVILEPCTHPDCGAGSRCASDSYRGAFAVQWNKHHSEVAPWGSSQWVYAVDFRMHMLFDDPLRSDRQESATSLLLPA